MPFLPFCKAIGCKWCVTTVADGAHSVRNSGVVLSAVPTYQDRSCLVFSFRPSLLNRHPFSKACLQTAAFSDSHPTLYVVHERAKPVLHGQNSTKPNLFHHEETTYRVG